MPLLTKLSFALAVFGGVILLMLGVLFGLLMSSVYPYGLDALSYASPMEVLALLLMPPLSLGPVLLVVGLFLLLRRQSEALNWIGRVGGLVVVGGWFGVFWVLRRELLRWVWYSYGNPELVLPFLPYLIGLTGCVVALRRSGNG